MTYKKADAIAAISTPQGVGGCALVRMTGKDAITVADRFFKNFTQSFIINVLSTYSFS